MRGDRSRSRHGKARSSVPRLIMRHFGHPDMGVYAEVLEGGVVRPGNLIVLLG